VAACPVESCRPILRLALWVGAVVGVVILVCASVHPLYRFADVEQVGQKLAFLRDKQKGCDYVLIGSSLTHSQLSPGTISAQLAKAGISIRGFNLGIHDMVPAETFFVARRVSDIRPARLRWMVIEVAPFRVAVPRDAGRVSKNVYWHDVRSTVESLRVLAAKVPSWRERAIHSVRHLALACRNYLGTGRGIALLRSRMQGMDFPETVVGYTRDGFVSYDDFIAMGYDEVRRLVERFSGQREVYEAEAAKFLEKRAAPSWRLCETELQLYADLIRDLRRHGIEPVFVLLPRLVDQSPLLDLARLSEKPAVIDLSDPARFPLFYNSAYHADVMHLNRQGAEMISIALAERLAPLLEADRRR
jgi:hypothetical protein